MSVQRASFYILLALVTIAFAWLLLPYYSAVLWAVILAVVFRQYNSAWNVCSAAGKTLPLCFPC